MNYAEMVDPSNVYTVLTADEFYDAFGIRLLPGDWEASVAWFRAEMCPTDDDIDPVEVLRALRDRRQVQLAVDSITLTTPTPVPE